MSLRANYLQNWMPVTRKNIIPYENKTGFQAQLVYFCCISQQKYAQDRKPQTG